MCIRDRAIGALAYGTESIEKVDKIVGPGNIYVALAKKAVYGHVSIDSIAGPSEILVLADDTATVSYTHLDVYKRQALDVYKKNPEEWKNLTAKGMRKNYSWKASSRKYEKLYSDL